MNFAVVGSNFRKFSTSVKYFSNISKSFAREIENTTTFISINLDTISSYIDAENLVKQLIKLKSLLSTDYFYNDIKFNIIGSKSHTFYNDILDSISALLIRSKAKQYEFIYDTVCKKLDDIFTTNNYCEFKDNTCIANRRNKTQEPCMGCCYAIEYKNKVKVIDKHLCKYMVNSKCTADCISCKLFTCMLLREKGVIFEPKNILLLSCFFDRKQQKVLQCNYYRTKSQIIKKLLEKNNMPHLIYYLKNCEYID